MVNFNFGINISSLLGLLNIAVAIVYFILTITKIIQVIRRSASAFYITTKILELVWCPLALLISGVILLFNGWRLDPILQLQQILLESVVIFLFTKDFIKG